MIQFYTDENVNGHIIHGLRLRGIDILTARDDHRNETNDNLVFVRATELNRVLVSQDDDLLRIAEGWQRNGLEFAGLIYAHQDPTTVRQYIDDLDLISQCETPEEYLNRIERLPLRPAIRR